MSVSLRPRSRGRSSVYNLFSRLENRPYFIYNLYMENKNRVPAQKPEENKNLAAKVSVLIKQHKDLMDKLAKYD